MPDVTQISFQQAKVTSAGGAILMENLDRKLEDPADVLSFDLAPIAIKTFLLRLWQ